MLHERTFFVPRMNEIGPYVMGVGLPVVEMRGGGGGQGG